MSVAVVHLLKHVQELGLGEGIPAAADAHPQVLPALLQLDEAVLAVAGRLHPGVVEAHDVGVPAHLSPRVAFLRRATSSASPLAPTSARRPVGYVFQGVT